MSEENKVILDKAEYEEIVKQLEILASTKPTQPKGFTVFTKEFWDRVITKLLATLISVKLWVLFFIVITPYELLKSGLISGSDYASIVVVVAPVVLGLREIAKIKMSNNDEESLITKIRKRLDI